MAISIYQIIGGAIGVFAIVMAIIVAVTMIYDKGRYDEAMERNRRIRESTREQVQGDPEPPDPSAA